MAPCAQAELKKKRQPACRRLHHHYHVVLASDDAELHHYHPSGLRRPSLFPKACDTAGERAQARYSSLSTSIPPTIHASTSLSEYSWEFDIGCYTPGVYAVLQKVNTVPRLQTILSSRQRLTVSGTRQSAFPLTTWVDCRGAVHTAAWPRVRELDDGATVCGSVSSCGRPRFCHRRVKHPSCVDANANAISVSSSPTTSALIAHRGTSPIPLLMPQASSPPSPPPAPPSHRCLYLPSLSPKDFIVG
ncbi:hypothetical protein DFP72DRAFT_905064 [Ephemerocybe angulata]|uniref:Uncharacterized protein n=1 Tax=Ephemerocybe angulata TaxID=980116 RepID=A0A8H6M4S5_9AGAR|nr:hypothetical protein DFP72DRAFT_905064 [Tulosesus angulatus]